VFYDEDGDPLCFSPDVIPSGTKLYLRIQSFSLSGSTAASHDAQRPKPKWTWDPAINTSPQIAYKLSADNTTVMHEGMDSSKYSMPILCGTTSFKSGQHRWQVSFTNSQGYNAFGLISNAERDQLRTNDFGPDFCGYPVFKKFF